MTMTVMSLFGHIPRMNTFSLEIHSSAQFPFVSLLSELPK
ncbi:protein of unknown function [Moritella yayanosii]|uniref:Uncharacterized protein n=1 Tax=Moritella yayanosii TaxID=69539 RepID=A0A330LJJ4_9GAMM|nr:protein of unknown function [Moritella yayanosii]